jgi:hypothetical protein
MTPDQISRYWEDIKACINISFPPTAELTDRGLNNILEKLLSDEMQAWILFTQEGDKATVSAMLVTQVWKDTGTENTNLLIYSFCSYSSLTLESWKAGLEGLRAFAEKNECFKIVAYTIVPTIINRVKSLGGDTSTVFLSLEV